MSLTVIIPAYNAVSFVGRALSSVPEGPFQTVVVDDGSQDGTADEVLRSMPSVQLIRQRIGRFREVNDRELRETPG